MGTSDKPLASVLLQPGRRLIERFGTQGKSNESGSSLGLRPCLASDILPLAVRHTRTRAVRFPP